MKKKKTILALMIVASLLAGPKAGAFEFKGYEWGQGLEDTREGLQRKDKKIEYNKKSNTLVYGDEYYGEKCKVSLLFTPKSGKLAGIALVWPNDGALVRIISELTRKYGKALEPGMKNRDIEYYLWKSPTDPNDRIALISDPKATVLGYYGGTFYEQYREEAGE